MNNSKITIENVSLEEEEVLDFSKMLVGKRIKLVCVELKSTEKMIRNGLKWKKE